MLNCVFFCLLLTPLTTLSQAPSKQNSSSPPSRGRLILKDEFAKASIRALRTVQGETGDFTIGADGTVLVPRRTQSLLDDLDADVETKGEQAILVGLNSLFTARLTNNLSVSVMSAQIKLMLSGHDPLENEVARTLHISDLLSRSPAIAEMRRKEASCSTQLETSLRSRRLGALSSCDREALEVKAPSTPDVQVQSEVSAIANPRKSLAILRTLSEGDMREIMANPATMAQLKVNQREAEETPAAKSQIQTENSLADHVSIPDEDLALVRSGQLISLV